MGRAPEVAWEESSQELYEFYRGERDTERRKRVHALWLVRSSRPPAEAAELAGVGKRTLERWLSWYRQGAGLRRCWRGCLGTARLDRPASSVGSGWKSC